MRGDTVTIVSGKYDGAVGSVDILDLRVAAALWPVQAKAYWTNTSPCPYRRPTVELPLGDSNISRSTHVLEDHDHRKPALLDNFALRRIWTVNR